MSPSSDGDLQQTILFLNVSDRVLSKEPKIIRNEQISMCGVNPVTVMLLCSEKLGARQTELVRYMTSGEVNGDKNRVVGYAGMIIS